MRKASSMIQKSLQNWSQSTSQTSGES
jgi:hypothetical protein